MRALVWIVEETWQATVTEAAAYLPADADITLLYVVNAEAEGVARASRHALLGRPQAPTEPLRAISEQAASELLADAQAQLSNGLAWYLPRGCHRPLEINWKALNLEVHEPCALEAKLGASNDLQLRTDVGLLSLLQLTEVPADRQKN